MSDRYCPLYVETLLCGIESELCRIMGNKLQEDYDSPFRNTGNEFICPEFEVRAYYWGDDEEEIEKPNFKCGNLEISWYKYLGRGMFINQRITPKKMVEIHNKCILYLRRFEEINEDFAPSRLTNIKDLTDNSKCKQSWLKKAWRKWKYRHEFKTKD